MCLFTIQSSKTTTKKMWMYSSSIRVHMLTKVSQHSCVHDRMYDYLEEHQDCLRHMIAMWSTWWFSLYGDRHMTSMLISDVELIWSKHWILLFSPPSCDCVTPSLVYQHVKDTVQELVDALYVMTTSILERIRNTWILRLKLKPVTSDIFLTSFMLSL